MATSWLEEPESRSSKMRVTLEFKVEDMWIGFFWKKENLWICVFPTIPIHIERHNRGHPYSGPFRGFACEKHLYPEFGCPDCKRIG